VFKKGEGIDNVPPGSAPERFGDAPKKSPVCRVTSSSKHECYSESVDPESSLLTIYLPTERGLLSQTNYMSRNYSRLRKTLATNIKRHRAKKSLSQETFAEVCGLHRTYIGSVERCERNVTLSTLEIFAKALGTPVPVLLTDQDEVK
jgi:DNA-binding XRE family transcriptional regulator